MAPQHTAGQQQQGPAAGTRAAARQRHQQQAAEMALPLLLQHDSMRTQLPLVCKLLCCSKALAAAVAEHNAGQPDMPCCPTVAARWLRKHARLVRSLTTSIYGMNACVAALMAAGPQSLMLQSLATEASDTSLPLLEQLPASRLTHLDWSVNEQSLRPQDRPAFVARLSAALGRLTALRSLKLQRSATAASPGLSGLSALTQLTALRFHGPLSDWQEVPPQLLELQLRTYHGEQQLDLRHLSAVTALTIFTPDVREGDVLPPNLLGLRVDDCRSVQPMLPLVQLQQLRVTFAGYDEETDITADQLRQLSRLTSPSLDYCYLTEPASAGAWPLLPLQQLTLGESFLSAPVCQCLAQLSGLTSLALQLFQLPQAGSGQQLATALRQLSGLQQLELSEPMWPDGTASDEEEAAGGQQPARDLRCCFQTASGSSLSAMTALTALSLSECDLSDAALTAIVSQLPGLQRLDCSHNEGITDAALPAIGQLRQLTRLRLSHTRVADAGLRRLRGLTRLKELDLCYTDVSDAGLGRLTGLVGLRALRVSEQVAVDQMFWLELQVPGLEVSYC